MHLLVDTLAVHFRSFKVKEFIHKIINKSQSFDTAKSLKDKFLTELILLSKKYVHVKLFKILEGLAARYFRKLDENIRHLTNLHKDLSVNEPAGSKQSKLSKNAI